MTSDPFRADGAPLLQGLGFEIAIERRRIADLNIQSGHLIACDPFDSPETEPFDFVLPAGGYPISVVLAEMRDTLNAAYLLVELSPNPATRWELANIVGDEQQTWNDPAHAGFHVESGIAAFLDDDSAEEVMDRMSTDAGEDDFNKLVRREIGKTRRGNNLRSGWANVDLGEGRNLVVVEVADGTYKTHLGRDADGEPALLVVDLGVLDIQFTPYGLRF